MLLLSLIFIALLLLWAVAWQHNPKFAFGVLLGVGLAWVAARAFEPYITGVEEMPVWLPALPVATIAVLLLVFGIVVWVRGDRALPPPPPRDTHLHPH